MKKKQSVTFGEMQAVYLWIASHPGVRPSPSLRSEAILSRLKAFGIIRVSSTGMPRLVARSQEEVTNGK